MVYSKTQEEHEKHLASILQLLREHKLYAKLSKCDLFILLVTDSILGTFFPRSGNRSKKDKKHHGVAYSLECGRVQILYGIGQVLPKFYLKFLKDWVSNHNTTKKRN